MTTGEKLYIIYFGLLNVEWDLGHAFLICLLLVGVCVLLYMGFQLGDVYQENVGLKRQVKQLNDRVRKLNDLHIKFRDSSKEIFCE